jgi:TonB family protein
MKGVSMKKIILSLSLLLALGNLSMAASLPENGVYLNKDGTPVTAAEEIPPSLTSAKMLPQTKDVHDALLTLPHSSATVLRITINEDGAVTHAEEEQSSTSLILDQYAASCVESWRFKPAMRGDRAVISTAAVPVRFISNMVSQPAAPKEAVMKDMNESVHQAAERNGHPLISVKAFIKADGKMDGRPTAVKEETSSIPAGDYKILAAYAEDCVRHWTFTPALNPDGEAIASEAIFPVQL